MMVKPLWRTQARIDTGQGYLKQKKISIKAINRPERKEPMLHAPKHSGTNFKALKPFLDIATDDSRHFKADGFMDLVIEDMCITDDIGGHVYTISHYGVQNGDLMADPDMELSVNMETGKIIPRTFRNDYIGTYQSVFKTINGKLMYSHRLLIDLDEFLWQWLKNIKDQGFTPEKSAYR